MILIIRKIISPFLKERSPGMSVYSRCAVNGHCWPTMDCTKEVAELLIAGIDF